MEDVLMLFSWLVYNNIWCVPGG